MRRLFSAYALTRHHRIHHLPGPSFRSAPQHPGTGTSSNPTKQSVPASQPEQQFSQLYLSQSKTSGSVDARTAKSPSPQSHISFLLLRLYPSRFIQFEASSSPPHLPLQPALTQPLSTLPCDTPPGRHRRSPDVPACCRSQSLPASRAALQHSCTTCGETPASLKPATKCRRKDMKEHRRNDRQRQQCLQPARRRC